MSKCDSNLPQNFVDQLTQIVSAENVLLQPADCWPYGYDNSRRHHPPDAVVFVHQPSEIKQIVTLCNEHKIPIVARGRGTGTTGASVPIRGGVVLAMERMNSIIHTDPSNRVMVVQPGVTNQEVQAEAAKHGFFWPPDPTSAAYCSIGGNLAYNSAGPRAVKYGTPRENTLGLRAISGSGIEIKAGVYTSKGVVGYDLTRLLIGSEGTLAIITEATLKLTPLPEDKHTIQLFYSNIHHAAVSVSNIMSQPVIPCALEFIDGAAIDMIRDYSKVTLPADAGAMLMIEVDGAKSCLPHLTERVIEAASSPGLLSVKTAQTDLEVAELWKTRKALSPALRKVAPKKINEDVVVPVSNMPQLIDGLSQLSQRHGIKIVNFGHAGNGNIHVNLLVDPSDPKQLRHAHTCLSDVFDLVLKLNGTLSGEHGVGIEKQAFVEREIDAATLSVMRSLKAQFDPNNILNPDKMLPL